MDIPQWIKDPPSLVSAIIALFSFFLSAVSLIIYWRIFRRDDYKLHIELQWNAEAIHEHGMRSPIKQRFGRIIVTNTGRRPVHVTFIGLQLPGRRDSSASWLEQSVKLGEGDASIIIKIPQDSTLEPFLERWTEIYATVETSGGRWHKSKPGSEPPIILPGFDFDSAGRLQDFSLLTTGNLKEPAVRPSRPKIEPRDFNRNT